MKYWILPFILGCAAAIINAQYWNIKSLKNDIQELKTHIEKLETKQ